MSCIQMPVNRKTARSSLHAPHAISQIVLNRYPLGSQKFLAPDFPTSPNSIMPLLLPQPGQQASGLHTITKMVFDAVCSKAPSGVCRMGCPLPSPSLLD